MYTIVFKSMIKIFVGLLIRRITAARMKLSPLKLSKTFAKVQIVSSRSQIQGIIRFRVVTSARKLKLK